MQSETQDTLTQGQPPKKKARCHCPTCGRVVHAKDLELIDLQKKLRAVYDMYGSP